MRFVKKLKKRILEYPDFLIIVISVFFGLIVSKGKIAADDLSIYKDVGSGISSWIKWTIDQYYTWSSRQLINFVWIAILRCGRWAWFLYMSISMFVMLKSLKLLFGSNDKRIELFGITMMMLFPFTAITNAGWVATTVSYFGPQAFAIMSLVPIKNALKGEKTNIFQFVIYCCCLLYGANAEQTCIVLLGLYGIATIYFIFYLHKCDWHILILTILAIISLVYTITCPGNWARDGAEVAHWFPTYQMLDLFNKVDIGLSTTLHWLFAEGRVFMIMICAMMAYFVWNKYTESLYRVVSFIPICAVLAMGPFSNILINLFPYMDQSMADVNRYGEFVADISQLGKGIIQFEMFLLICICLCVEIFLLNDTIEDIIIDMSLAIMGVASRVMMGFSPTVYASSERTYTSLIFCFILMAVHIYSKNYKCLNVRNNSKILNIERYILWTLVILGFMNLMYLVAVVLY